jgi:hypothetical protein
MLDLNNNAPKPTDQALLWDGPDTNHWLVPGFAINSPLTYAGRGFLVAWWLYREVQSTERLQRSMVVPIYLLRTYIHLYLRTTYRLQAAPVQAKGILTTAI